MIRTLVDFALNNRFVVLAVAILLLGWGAVSFHNLPVEAYPDIADNYVTVITQWPGRSAEEIRRDIDIQRRALGANVESLRGKVTEVTDWRRQVEEHKQQLIIGAAAVGFLVGIKLMRSRRRRKRAF